MVATIIPFRRTKTEGDSKIIEANGPRQKIYIQTKYDSSGIPLVTHPDDQIATTTIFLEDGSLVSERFVYLNGQQEMLMYDLYGNVSHTMLLGEKYGTNT